MNIHRRILHKIGYRQALVMAGAALAMLAMLAITAFTAGCNDSGTDTGSSTAGTTGIGGFASGPIYCGDNTWAWSQCRTATDPLEFRIRYDATIGVGGIINNNPYGESYIPLDNLLERGLVLNTDLPWAFGWKCLIGVPPSDEIARHFVYVSTLPTADPNNLDPWLFAGGNIPAGRFQGNKGDNGSFPPDGGIIDEAPDVTWAVGDLICGILSWSPTTGLHLGVTIHNPSTGVMKGYVFADDASSNGKSTSDVGEIAGQFICLDEWDGEGEKVDGLPVGHSGSTYQHFFIGNFAGTGGGEVVPGTWWSKDVDDITLNSGMSVFSWDFRNGNPIGEQLSS